MKLNKKILGMFLIFNMMFSLSFVGVKALKRNVAVEFILNGKDMQKRKEGSKDSPDRSIENKTSEKEGVFLYMVLKKAFKDGGLWNKDIRKKLIDEVFLNKDGIKLTTEITFYDLNDGFVKKLKNIVKTTNFKAIKITEDMFKEALKDMKEVRGKNVKDAIAEIENSKKELKEDEEGINKKFSKEEREAEEQFIRNGEGFIEDNKRKLKAVGKVKFKDVKNLSKDLKVSKTLIDLKTGKRI